jgi:hypothetical protein
VKEGWSEGRMESRKEGSREGGMEKDRSIKGGGGREGSRD